MMDHLREQDIAALLLGPDGIQDAQRKRMESHIAQCSICREQMDALARLYASVSDSLMEPPSAKDRAVAHQVLHPARGEELSGGLLQLPAHQDGSVGFFYGRGVSRYQGAVSRVVQAIRVHPVRFAGGMSLAAALCIWAIIAIRPSGKDSNPVYAKILSSVLTAYNEKGAALWTKVVPGLPDATSERRSSAHIEEHRILSVEDIDGDGIAEILMAGVGDNTAFQGDTLFCFNAAGTLRWKSGVGSFTTFGSSQSVGRARPCIRDFVSLRASPSGKIQMFVLAPVPPLSPTKLLEISPQDGHELHAWYHRGECSLLLNGDVDGDGREELIVSGINDAFDRAILAVLDPSSIDGYAPVPPDQIPSGMPKAHEEWYLSFPIPGLIRPYKTVLYNVPVMIQLTDRKEIVIQIVDHLRQDLSLPRERTELVYSLDSQMKVLGVTLGDGYEKMQEWLIANHRIRNGAIPAYYNDLRDSVKYWDGEGFVGWNQLRPIP